jgi:hypothetical protein
MSGNIHVYILHTGALQSKFSFKDEAVNEWARLLEIMFKTGSHFPRTTLNLICNVPGSGFLHKAVKYIRIIGEV